MERFSFILETDKLRRYQGLSSIFFNATIAFTWGLSPHVGVQRVVQLELFDKDANSDSDPYI